MRGRLRDDDQLSRFVRLLAIRRLNGRTVAVASLTSDSRQSVYLDRLLPSTSTWIHRR